MTLQHIASKKADDWAFLQVVVVFNECFQRVREGTS